MQIPIPFFGWVSIDEEDNEQMLREQIRSQQAEIDRLKKMVFDLQLKVGSQKRKVEDGTSNVK
jgi:hypothetical protein